MSPVAPEQDRSPRGDTEDIHSPLILPGAILLRSADRDRQSRATDRRVAYPGRMASASFTIPSEDLSSSKGIFLNFLFTNSAHRPITFLVSSSDRTSTRLNYSH